ncbi:MAG: biopolymer transporter ExbD [Nitrospirota bacterium]
MEFERRRHNHAHLNIAPLVDVVFLLLLFFMLTSHLVQEPAINLKLPHSKTAKTGEQSVNTLLITQKGEIFFVDKRVDLENLGTMIKESFADTKNEFLRIKADRNVDVGLLINVIDEVRLSGINNFSIVAEKK